MAKGDTNYSVGRGRGSGGGSEPQSYDDEGRGYSKELYELFTVKFAGHARNLFDGTVNRTLIAALIKNTTWRYGIHDFSDRVKWDNWNPDNDGRIRRDVVKACGLATWNEFAKLVVEIREEMADEKWKRDIAYSIANLESDRQWEATRQAAAEAAKLRREEEYYRYSNVAELVVGALRSDVESAVQMKERLYTVEGDWLEDPVDQYMTGHGYGEEISVPGGVKIQITLSLDLSNSMQNNRIAEVSMETYINLHMALMAMAAEHKDNLFYAPFVFSIDTSEWNRTTRTEVKRLGKKAQRVVMASWEKDRAVDDPFHLGAMERYRDANTYNVFDGQDTWIYPLFEEIELWENTHSAPGAMRLDLIISDAVLTHRTDLQQANVIQERRDGSLQTVILNLMPEREWHNSALPRRCVQYAVDRTNLAGMARSIISQFLQLYI